LGGRQQRRPRRAPTPASARHLDPRSTHIKASLRTTLVGAAALVGAAVWWRRYPSACPYSQRFWVEAPHPFITRARLRDALGEIIGARVLEVGPGTGYYSIPVAEWIRPAGRLEIFDLQREMLDHTLRRAEARGLANVTATQGDARSLPYDDASFDAAYLITVLGEIPDQHVALAELRRVLKPTGRLVVGSCGAIPTSYRSAASANAPPPPACASSAGSDRGSGSSPRSPPRATRLRPTPNSCAPRGLIRPLR
jgi:SAM-dependent methyltransferase